MSSYVSTRRRLGAGLLAATTATALVLVFGGATADAAIVPTVPLGTAASYSVLAGSTVTNTGNSVLNRSLGLSPGLDAAITGFPPGLINGERTRCGRGRPEGRPRQRVQQRRRSAHRLHRDC